MLFGKMKGNFIKRHSMLRLWVGSFSDQIWNDLGVRLESKASKIFNSWKNYFQNYNLDLN